MKSNTFELHNYAATFTAAANNNSSNSNNNSRVMKTKSNNPKTASIKATSINGLRNEKYSLRQRQKRRNARTLLSSESNELTDFSSDQYTSIDSPLTAATAAAKQQQNKAKTKAAPLSKYRRKTANARERTRMREINSAFENLRQCVPQTITGDDPSNANEKLTKITTLRLAMKYISLLSEALTNPSFETDFLIECLRDSNTRHRYQAEQANIYALEQGNNSSSCNRSGSGSGSAIKTKIKAIQKQTSTKKGTTVTKRASRQKTKTQTEKPTNICSPESAYGSSLGSASTSPICSTAVSPSSAYTALTGNLHMANDTISLDLFSSSSSSIQYSSNVLLDITESEHNNAFELNTLLLESDGESLHLSEHCLSPLQTNGYNNMLVSSKLPRQIVDSPVDVPMSEASLEQTDMELNLRLLDTNANAFEVFGAGGSEQQQPSACVSPLATLDSFNPFSDLLHNDFPEHNALDLFLT